MYLIGWPGELCGSHEASIREAGSILMGWAPPFTCLGMYAVAITDVSKSFMQNPVVPLRFLMDVTGFKSFVTPGPRMAEEDRHDGYDMDRVRFRWLVRELWTLPDNAKVNASGTKGIAIPGSDFSDIVLKMKRRSIVRFKPRQEAG